MEPVFDMFQRKLENNDGRWMWATTRCYEFCLQFIYHLRKLVGNPSPSLETPDKKAWFAGNVPISFINATFNREWMTRFETPSWRWGGMTGPPNPLLALKNNGLLEDPLYPPCCASWYVLSSRSFDNLEAWQETVRDQADDVGWCLACPVRSVCRFVWIYHHCKNIDFMKGLCILLHLSDATFRVKILVDMDSFIFWMLLQVAGGKRRLSLASPPSLTSIWSCSTSLLFQKWRDKKSSLSKYVEPNSFPLFSPCDFSLGSWHQIPQHFPNHRQVLVRFVLYLDVSEQVMEVPRLGGKMAASLVGNETK